MGRMRLIRNRGTESDVLDSIKIGGICYRIVEDFRLADEILCGQFRPMRAEIAVMPGAESEMLPQTLWHEVLHGLLIHAGIRDGHDETHIDLIAYGIVQVLRDNPALVEATCRIRS